MLPYFYKLNNPLVGQETLCDFMREQTQWLHKFGFDYVRIPDNIFKDDIIQDIKNQFGGVNVLIRLDKMNFYNWHVDVERSVTINSIIDGFDCFTFFTDHMPDPTVEAFNPIHEIVYQPGDAYVLNTQMPHAVYNRTQCRVALSTSFNKPLHFDTIINYCIKKGY